MRLAGEKGTRKRVPLTVVISGYFISDRFISSRFIDNCFFNNGDD